MNALIDFVLLHPVVLFYIFSGVAVILYSCFANECHFREIFHGGPRKESRMKRLVGCTYMELPSVRYRCSTGCTCFFSRRRDS
jgi:hypothetical protein